MRKSILEVYALSVCFACVLCFVVALGFGIYDCIRLANPEFTLDKYDYNLYQDNDSFWELNKSKSDRDDKKIEMPRPPEDELTKRRLRGYRRALIAERRGGLQGVTFIIIILVINITVFIGHWFIARRARESQ